jgi:hypothetical protein
LAKRDERCSILNLLDNEFWLYFEAWPSRNYRRWLSFPRARILKFLEAKDFHKSAAVDILNSWLFPLHSLLNSFLRHAANTGKASKGWVQISLLLATEKNEIAYFFDRDVPFSALRRPPSALTLHWLRMRNYLPIVSIA